MWNIQVILYMSMNILLLPSTEFVDFEKRFGTDVYTKDIWFTRFADMASGNVTAGKRFSKCGDMAQELFFSPERIRLLPDSIVATRFFQSVQVPPKRKPPAMRSASSMARRVSCTMFRTAYLNTSLPFIVIACLRLSTDAWLAGMLVPPAGW